MGGRPLFGNFRFIPPKIGELSIDLSLLIFFNDFLQSLQSNSRIFTKMENNPRLIVYKRLLSPTK